MSEVGEERLLEKGVTEGVGAMHISVSPPLPQVKCWHFRSSATLLYVSLGDEGGEGVLTWLESDAAPLSHACGPCPQHPAAGTLEEAVPCTHIHTHIHAHDKYPLPELLAIVPDFLSLGSEQGRYLPLPPKC